MKRTIITLVASLILSIIGNTQTNFTDTCLLDLINLNLRNGKQELTYRFDLYHVTKNHNNSMIVFPETVIEYRGFKISGVSNSEYGTNDTIKQTTYDTTRYKGGCGGFELPARLYIDDTSMVCKLFFDALYNSEKYANVLSDDNFRNITFTITKCIT